VWIKQTDAKGNVYYFNQDTLESAWFPPCMVCMRLEAKKVCFSCEDAGADGLFYCNECFEKARISASRRVEAPSSHRRDSCPSDEVVSGFFFAEEAVRTVSVRAGARRRRGQ
jgi:hypothetical protein